MLLVLALNFQRATRIGLVRQNDRQRLQYAVAPALSIMTDKQTSSCIIHGCLYSQLYAVL